MFTPLMPDGKPRKLQAGDMVKFDNLTISFFRAGGIPLKFPDGLRNWDKLTLQNTADFFALAELVATTHGLVIKKHPNDLIQAYIFVDPDEVKETCEHANMLRIEKEFLGGRELPVFEHALTCRDCMVEIIRMNAFCYGCNDPLQGFYTSAYLDLIGNNQEHVGGIPEHIVKHLLTCQTCRFVAERIRELTLGEADDDSEGSE